MSAPRKDCVNHSVTCLSTGRKSGQGKGQPPALNGTLHIGRQRTR